jgi:hypothetical protein
MNKEKIIRELLQDNNIEFDFIRSLERRGSDFDFVNLALQAKTGDMSKVYPHFGKEFVIWEVPKTVPSGIMINFDGHVSSVPRLFTKDLIDKLSALYIHNCNVQSFSGYKSWFVEAYTALRDSNLKLWDFNFSRKGYSLAGDTTLEILNVKPLVTPYALRFNILRSNNVLNISSKVAPVEGTTNNKVTIDMKNLSGWNVEIIFGDFCRDNEVDIINVKDDRNVIADYYLSENSVRVGNIVKVNGIRKL